MIIEFVTVLLLSHVLVFWLQGTCVLSPPPGLDLHSVPWKAWC